MYIFHQILSIETVVNKIVYLIEMCDSSDTNIVRAFQLEFTEPPSEEFLNRMINVYITDFNSKH